MDVLPMVFEQDGRPVTTSRAVAEQFGKQHKDVIRAIESTIATLEETGEGKAFNERNFAPISYNDSINREKPAYLMTRSGFTLLAMGFTGAKALSFKVAYINAFDRMEQLIKGGTPSPAISAAVEARLSTLSPQSLAVIPYQELSTEFHLALFLQRRLQYSPGDRLDIFELSTAFENACSQEGIKFVDDYILEKALLAADYDVVIDVRSDRKYIENVVLKKFWYLL